MNEIYTIAADGSNRTRLATFPTATVRSPVFSPDGHRVAFYVSDDTTSHIFAMNLDRTEMTQITQVEGQNRWFTWADAKVVSGTN
jgi:Tol biopolymer transport system component